MPKRIPATKQAQRAKVARGIIEQKPVAKIAAELGVTRKTVYTELEHPETQALIQSWMRPHHHRLQKIIDSQISNVERALTMDDKARLERIEALTDRISRLRTVIAERSEDPALSGVPGGKTGTIVHQMKMLGSGPAATMIDEYEVDTGLLKELREHEKQLRDELNDFSPNLKAVERARDLLELAEGTRKDENDGKQLRWQGELTELIALYARVVKQQN